MAKGYVSIGEIAAAMEMIDIRCDRPGCGRHGRYRTAALVARYGAESSIQPWQDDLTRGCRISRTSPWARAAPPCARR